MDKGTIDEARTERQGVAVTSSRTSRRSASLAPLMAFLALIGGATFFGLLAVSGKSAQGRLSNTAVVATSPSPSKAQQPKVHPVASRVPTPPAPSTQGADHYETSSPAPGLAGSPNSDDVARLNGALPRKPVDEVAKDVQPGALCTTSETQGRTAGGKLMVCHPSPDDQQNRWQPV
jgi:hypothetical protein